MLNRKLLSRVPGSSTALVTGDNFGSGNPAEISTAVQALKAETEELNIITKSVDQAFLTHYNNVIGTNKCKIVNCPTLIADVDDELEIQTLKIRNKTKNLDFPIV